MSHTPDRQGESSTTTTGAHTFEGAFRKETVRSESRRAAFTALLLAGLCLLVLTIRFLPGISSEEMRASFSRLFWPLMAVVGVLLAYEAGVWFWLRARLRSNIAPGMAFRYLNALVEISLPTCIILLSVPVYGPVGALSAAAPLVYFLFIVLTALTLDFRLCAFAGAVAAIQFGTISLLLLAGADEAGPVAGLEILFSPHQYLAKSTILLFGGLLAGLVAQMIRRQIAAALRTVQERDRAVSIFGQHVSPQVADMLLKQPAEFSGEERNVCVMFLDIRDFSKIAGARGPSEVMEYLNTLFSFMITVVNDHRGIVNKFLGDGFMAVFGAPLEDTERCRHAILASEEILERVETLNATGTIPPTRLGIGLHMGQAVTGNVGSNERKEYTVIGDVVNLASRIEQATKLFAARLLISEAVWQVIDQQAHPGEDLGEVELKGQAKPARLFKLA